MRRAIIVLGIGMLAGLPFLGGTNALELLTVDLRFLLSGVSGGGEESERIALVLMDGRSEREFGVPAGSKWRQFHPALLGKLGEAGADLVVFDADFFGVEPEWDGALAAAVRRSGLVVAGERSPGSTTAALRDAFLGLGSLAVTPWGGVPRRVPDWDTVSRGSAPLSVVAHDAMRVLPADTVASPAATAATAPAAQGQGFWIDFRRPPSWFPSFSYVDIARASEGRLADAARTPLSFFKDRVVFVGDATGVDDYVLPNTLGRKERGVVGQAFALDTLLGDWRLRRAGTAADLAFLAAFCGLFVAASAARRPVLRFALRLFVPLAFLAVALLLFDSHGWWVPLAPLLVSIWALLIADRVLQRRLLLGSLRRAVGFDPVLIDRFREERARSGGAVRKRVAVLIADVRDYTRYVSMNDSDAVARVMGEYMTAMERCVTSSGGYVNKYVGDEIVAVFGFPLAEEGAAGRAVGAAVAMLAEFGRLSERWRWSGVTPLSGIGIGVDSGEASFVEVGGRSKSQFDIVGNCVNGASRIEALTKDLGVPLLVSAEAVAGLGESLRGSFSPRGTVSIRGQGERELWALAGS